MSSESPFPKADTDVFLSSFIFSARFNEGPLQGMPINLTLPVAIQTVARSNPFIYQGAGQQVEVPLPRRSTLKPVLTEADFPQLPEPYFQPGKEVIWMQIIDLDARGDTPIGPVRIIIGETLKREYPDLFLPSLGVAQSLGDSGFPARLFFDPTGVLETQAGAWRAVHGVLSYGRIDRFPPVGVNVQTSDVIPLHSTDQLRRAAATGGEAPASGVVLGLTHTINTELHIRGDEAFDLVEKSVSWRG